MDGGGVPERALDAASQDYQATYAAPDAALDAKTMELIALAVAAQIPCEYCVLGHTRAAAGAGASDEEIKEAVAVAAQVRKLSTMLNGHLYDMDQFRAELGGQPSGNRSGARSRITTSGQAGGLAPCLGYVAARRQPVGKVAWLLPASASHGRDPS